MPRPEGPSWRAVDPQSQHVDLGGRKTLWTTQNLPTGKGVYPPCYPRTEPCGSWGVCKMATGKFSEKGSVTPRLRPVSGSNLLDQLTDLFVDEVTFLHLLLNLFHRVDDGGVIAVAELATDHGI